MPLDLRSHQSLPFLGRLTRGLGGGKELDALGHSLDRCSFASSERGVTLLEGNAVAATCDDSTHVWVEAQPENGVYRRGIEVRDPGLYTGGPQFTDCFRVASNILWKSGSDNIEIGWIIDTPA